MADCLPRQRVCQNPLRSPFHAYRKRVPCLVNLSASEWYGLTTGKAEATIFVILELHPSGPLLYCAPGVFAGSIFGNVEQDCLTRQSVVLSAFRCCPRQTSRDLFSGGQRNVGQGPTEVVLDTGTLIGRHG